MRGRWLVFACVVVGLYAIRNQSDLPELAAQPWPLRHIPLCNLTFIKIPKCSSTTNSVLTKLLGAQYGLTASVSVMGHTLLSNRKVVQAGGGASGSSGAPV